MGVLNSVPFVPPKNQLFVNKLQESMAKYEWDNTHKSSFLFIGDSAVIGEGITDFQRAYPTLIEKSIQTKQYAANYDVYLKVPAANYPAGGDTFAFTGTWSKVSNAFSRPGDTDTGWLKSTGVAANGNTFTISTGGYKVKVLFASDGAFDAEVIGAISYSVNGGDAVPVELSGEAVPYKCVEIDPGGSFDIVFTRDLEGDEVVAVGGVHYTNGSIYGLRVYNIAVSGTTTANWVTNKEIIKAYSPEVSYVALGGNDVTGEVTPAAYRANMIILLDELASHGDVILGFYSPWYGVSAAILALIPQYRAVCQSLARSYNIPLVDYHEIYDNGIGWNTAELFSDVGALRIHPNDDGYRVKANKFLGTIQV